MLLVNRDFLAQHNIQCMYGFFCSPHHSGRRNAFEEGTVLLYIYGTENGTDKCTALLNAIQIPTSIPGSSIQICTVRRAQKKEQNLKQGTTPGGCINPTVSTPGQALQILRKDYSLALEKNAARKALLKWGWRCHWKRFWTRIKNKKEKVILHLLQKSEKKKRNMANDKEPRKNMKHELCSGTKKPDTVF